MVHLTFGATSSGLLHMGGWGVMAYEGYGYRVARWIGVVVCLCRGAL